jgi:hypothetical protein
MGLRYPSKAYKDVATANIAAETHARMLTKQLSNAQHAAYLQHMQGRGAQSNAQRAASFQFVPDSNMLAQSKAAAAHSLEMRKQREAHPHHGEFIKAAERHQNLVRGGNYGE